eukprot:gene28652-34594_t
MRVDVCCICLDSFTLSSESDLKSPFASIHGCFCSSGHFCCKQDLLQYCSENVFPTVFDLKSKEGKVSCPRSECSDFFDSLTIYENLDELQKIRYINIFREVILPSYPLLAQTAAALRDMLVLSCPVCHVAIDPTPDACSAVQCLSCGFYYCNFCFQSFASEVSSDNRVAAHEHAATHKVVAEGEAQDAFLPLELVLQGQNSFQRKKLIKYLQLVIGSNSLMSRSSNGLQTASVAMLLAYEDIRLLGWQPLEVWNEALAGSDINFLSSISLELSSNVVSSKSLALAMLSHNLDAARQILLTDEGSIDVNYRHPISLEDQTEINYPLTSIAVLLNMDEIAEELLRRGADVMQAESKLGRTVMYVIVEKGGQKLLEFVFQHCATFDWNQSLTAELCGFSALDIASRYDRGFLIAHLAKRGVDMCKEDGECNYTPLVMAVVLDHHWTATELIKWGADIKRLTSRGTSAAKIAAEKGNLAILMTALQSDSSLLSAPTSSAVNILETAIFFKQYHVINFLIAHKAAIDFVNDEGSCPLITALLCEDEYSSLMLLQAGADVNVAFEKYPSCISQTCTADGALTPLDVSVLFRKVHITKLLLSMGISSNSVCMQEKLPIAFLAVREGNVHALQLLIEFGANLQDTVNEKNIMYYIVQKGLVDAFFVYKSHVLFDVNAPVGLPEENNRPLHVAAMFDHPHFVSLFISMGADILATNGQQHTALDIAREAQAERAELALLSYLR